MIRLAPATPPDAWAPDPASRSWRRPPELERGTTRRALRGVRLHDVVHAAQFTVVTPTCLELDSGPLRRLCAACDRALEATGDDVNRYKASKQPTPSCS
ncbi:hypothetical protein GCM10020220_005280 [Nonomuraea rubra]